MIGGRVLTLAVETRWIGGETGRNIARRTGKSRPVSPEWLVHGLGWVHMELRGGRLSVCLDGGWFDRSRCERLIDALGDFANRISWVDVSVWCGRAAGGGAWMEQSFRTVDDAQIFARRVAAVTGGSDLAGAVRAVPLRLEAIPLERRGFFETLIADWSRDRRSGSDAVLSRFRPGSEVAHEGLKVVRRFGENLRFEAYRVATAHRWARDQGRLLVGGDLRAVADRRLARTLLRSAAEAASTGGPVIEEISGLMQIETGYRFDEYYRLTLPLVDPEGDVALIATRW